MLWGVAPYRHLHKAIVTLSERYSLTSIRQFSIQKRWLVQTHTRTPRVVSNVPLEPSEKPDPFVLRRGQLPSELLAIMDNLFSRDRTRRGLLRAIRSSPHLLEVFLDRDKARKVAEAMVLTQFPQRAHRILLLAHRLGCPLKQNAYECVAFQLAKTRQWHIIPSVVLLGMKHTGRTTVRLLNWQIRTLVETCHFESLGCAADQFKQRNLKPNRATFHLLISGYIRNRNLTKAREYLQTMEESGYPIDPPTHALVVSVYRSLGPDTHVQGRAFEALRDVGRHSATAVLNSLMQLRIDACDFPGVLQVLSLFNQHHVTSALSEDTTLAGGDKSSSLPSPLTSPNSPPISFDATTFSMLLNYLVSRNDAPRALTVFRRMIAFGVLPDTGTIAALVRVHFAMGDEGIAIQIVAKMCESNEELSRLFDRLMSSSTENIEIPFTATRLQLSTEIFNALMQGILNTRGLRGANIVIRIMRASNISPDAQTIEILIAHLDKGEHIHPRILLRILRSLPSATVHPTLRHLHVILRSILRHDKYLRYGTGWNIPAAKFSPQRCDKSHGYQNSKLIASKSFNPIDGVDIPLRLSYRPLVRPIVQSLASRDITSDRATIALRIRNEAVNKSNLDSARNVFHTMLADGMHPNEYHFSALMEGYAQNGDLRTAEAILHSAVRAGIKPNVVMFTILIVGHARQGNPDYAMSTFRRMVAAGIKPDVPAIDAVTSAYFIVGAYAMARRVLSNLWPYVRPFPKALHSAPLKQLAREFRALHGDDHGSTQSFPRYQRLRLFRQLKGLVETWATFPDRSRARSRCVAKTIHHVPRTATKLQNFGVR